MKILVYISELIFPSKSAYSIQVMKMCDAFQKKGFKVNLFVLDTQNKQSIHGAYNCREKFKIVSFGIKRNNFVNRIRYTLKILLKLKSSKEEIFFFSRSIISGLILSFFYKNIIIEIHHALKGFTYFFFHFLKKMNLMKNIKYVFISHNLKKKFKLKNKSIVLDDAVDYDNYSKLKLDKTLNKTCVYTGSLAKGKGLETIFKIAKILPKINFDIYGDFTNSNFSKKDLMIYKNIKYKGYVKNKKIPEILNSYKVYLMPYSKKVYVRSKNIEVGKYMSPLKLFEYMASKGVLFASDMHVYKHILNKKNSILIKNNSINEWKKKINNFFKDPSKFKNLSKNATNYVKENTWENRVDKIKDFIDA